MNITRFIKNVMKQDLNKKMVFLGGPRQVGKTTLSKSFIKNKVQYLSWDDLADRQIIKSHKIDPKLKIIVLDEIHKYARWRMLIKGLYDKYRDQLSILVTGSARLDYYRKGGDSLFGRFHYYRLHPFTLQEVDRKFQRKTTLNLLKFSGFPEPFNSKSEKNYKRWRRERLARVVYQDISDLSNIKDISKIDLLVDLLPSRVGSTLSVKSLQEDLDVSPNTVSHWLTILEYVYYCYRIYPFVGAKIRTVKKTPKLYLWDWAEIEDSGPRFENFVAGHLLKFCHWKEDTEGDNMQLCFLRDIDGREIDFVVIKNKRPLFAVECKTGEKNFSKSLFYFRERLPIPQFYQVHLGTKDYLDGNCRVLPFELFCQIENIP